MNSETFTPPKFNPAKKVPYNTRKVLAHLQRDGVITHNQIVALIDGDDWLSNAARWLTRFNIRVGFSRLSPLCYVNCANSLGTAVRELLAQVIPDEPMGSVKIPTVVGLGPIIPDNVGERLHLCGSQRIAVDPSELTIVSDGPMKTGSDNAAKYPKYFKALPQGVSPDAVDTYAIAQMFPVDDPSGAILHARKKLLIPGVRSGGKSMRKDIIEARDTLNRWLELNPEA